MENKTRKKSKKTMDNKTINDIVADTEVRLNKFKKAGSYQTLLHTGSQLEILEFIKKAINLPCYNGSVCTEACKGIDEYCPACQLKKEYGKSGDSNV